MSAVLWPHVVVGLIAILLGGTAIAVRKGGRLHARIGTWFAVSMLFVGGTAIILEIFFANTTGAGGMMTCYFVATSWMTARRRDGRAGRFEKAACGVITIIGAYFIGCAIAAGFSPTGRFAGHVPNFYLAFGGLCLLAAALDLNFILRGVISSRQRLSRHLWRMCFAFFFATTSFFLGQRDTLPTGIQQSPILYVLAIAPLLAMLFWLARIRLVKAVERSRESGLIRIGSNPPARI